MNLFSKVHMDKAGLRAVSDAAKAADDADMMLRYEPGGYEYYSPEGVLRALIVEARAGERDGIIDFPNQTQADRDNTLRVVKMAMEAGLLVAVIQENDTFKRVRFAWE